MARLGTLGTVAQHKLPCPSDADPFPGDCDDSMSIDDATDDAIAIIGRACRANDPAATADLLREAAAMLVAIADEVTQ